MNVTRRRRRVLRRRSVVVPVEYPRYKTIECRACKHYAFLMRFLAAGFLHSFSFLSKSC